MRNKAALRAMATRSEYGELSACMREPGKAADRARFKAEHSRAMRRAAANDVEERLDGDLDEWELSDIWFDDDIVPQRTWIEMSDLRVLMYEPLRIPLAILARVA